MHAGLPGRVCRGQQKTLGIPERGNQVWLSTPVVIPEFGKLRQKDGEFRASLDIRERLCLKIFKKFFK